MTCKYFDSGWCYAPKDVKNNSVQGGCFEPEYCATYLMQNKTPMTEKEHLECEIKELELEIEQKAKGIGNLKDILERRQQKLKQMNDAHRNTNEAVENKRKEHLVSDLQSKNWYVNMREFLYPQLEVVDENTVKIEGVEYKKVEKEKPQTLYDALCEKGNVYANVSAIVCEIVKEWLPNTRFEDGNDYNIGWNECLQHLRENLK
jgi:hypothetical protein